MTEFILILSVVFITAGLLLIVANHFGLPPVPFYIIAGLITGQFVAQGSLIELALWGIAFLVFVFGIRVDLGDLQSVLRDGEFAAFAQLVIVAPIAFFVGYSLLNAFGFEHPFRNAVYFSTAATLSSTLVGARILEEEIRKNLVYGRLASSIHFFDDIVAIGVLLVLSTEVLTDLQLITSKIGLGTLFLLAGLLVYRHGYPLLIRAARGGDELVLMGSISILITFLAAAEAVGLSIVVGAFAAGIAIRTDGVQSVSVHNGIESIKDFFAAIFFVTIGAMVTVPTVDVLVLSGVLLLLVIFVNPIVYTLTFVYEGYDGRTAFLAGSNLNQVSELSLVVAIQAFLLGTITESLFDAIILTAAITMILSTLTSRYENVFYDHVLSNLFRNRTRNIDEHSEVESGLTDHVIVVGYGRQGRRIVKELESLGKGYVVVENDPARRNDIQSECHNYVFGDAMAAYPMELARSADARLIISTADYKPVSESLLDLETDAEIVLRTNSSAEAEELLDAGATFVTVPSVLASDQLTENVERVLGEQTDAAVLEREHKVFLREMELANISSE